MDNFINQTIQSMEQESLKNACQSWGYQNGVIEGYHAATTQVGLFIILFFVWSLGILFVKELVKRRGWSDKKLLTYYKAFHIGLGALALMLVGLLYLY